MLSDNFAIRDINYTYIDDGQLKNIEMKKINEMGKINEMKSDKIKNVITMCDMRTALRNRYPNLSNPVIWIEIPYYLNEEAKYIEITNTEQINDPICDINVDKVFKYCNVILCNNPNENSKYNDLYQVHQLDGYRIMYGEYETFKQLY